MAFKGRLHDRIFQTCILEAAAKGSNKVVLTNIAFNAPMRNMLREQLIQAGPHARSLEAQGNWPRQRRLPVC